MKMKERKKENNTKNKQSADTLFISMNSQKLIYKVNESLA